MTPYICSRCHHAIRCSRPPDEMHGAWCSRTPPGKPHDVCGGELVPTHEPGEINYGVPLNYDSEVHEIYMRLIAAAKSTNGRKLIDKIGLNQKSVYFASRWVLDHVGEMGEPQALFGKREKIYDLFSKFGLLPIDLKYDVASDTYMGRVIRRPPVFSEPLPGAPPKKRRSAYEGLTPTKDLRETYFVPWDKNSIGEQIRFALAFASSISVLAIGATTRSTSFSILFGCLGLVIMAIVLTRG